MLWVMAKGGGEVKIFVGGGSYGGGGWLHSVGVRPSSGGELATMSYVGEMGYKIRKFPLKLVNIFRYSQGPSNIPSEMTVSPFLNLNN